MKKQQITTEIEIYESIKELAINEQLLMQKAMAVRVNAYAPYSQFLVGAAILLSNQEIVVGSNQENASYPSGLCAERTAIYAAGANFPHEKILQIAITAGPKNKLNMQPVPPCGACRQAIAEYEQKQKQPIEVFFMGTSGQICKVQSLLSLLPLAFHRDFL